jgi:hypothetical protein
MFDHAPRMKAQPAHFNPGEMRELLSYLWARQFFEDAGDAGRGKRILPRNIARPVTATLPRVRRSSLAGPFLGLLWCRRSGITARECWSR